MTRKINVIITHHSQDEEMRRGPNISSPVLLNVLNGLWKRYKMRGLPTVRFYLSHDNKTTLKSRLYV